MKDLSLFPATGLCASIALAGVPAAQAAEEKVSLVQKATAVEADNGVIHAIDTVLLPVQP